jgi:hypothetical protein
MHPVVPLLFAVLTACPAQPGFEGSRLSVELPRIPVWPPDGRHPAEFADQHVFFDEKTREIVVSIPSRPGSNESDILERQQLSIGVCPSVSLKAGKTMSPDGKQILYFYSYTFANHRIAKQALGTITLGVPLPGVSLSLAGPHDWGAEAWEPTASILAGRLQEETEAWGKGQRERIQKMTTRTQARWFAKLSDFTIAPGRSLSPFTIQTNARPGVLAAYFRGNVYPISTREEWDIKVSGQLATLNDDENDSVSMPLLGPKFPPETTSQTIAKDYLASIDRLVKEGKLSAESSFIREAVGKLTGLAAAAPGVRRSPTVWRARPVLGLESELALGMQLSLE